LNSTRGGMVDSPIGKLEQLETGQAKLEGPQIEPKQLGRPQVAKPTARVK